MQHMSRVAAILAVWGGIAGLSYMFHSFGILSWEGAAGMIFVAFVLTLTLWLS